MTLHVVITGGAGGLGWELAQRYWQKGYHIHLLDCDATGLAKCASQLTQRLSTYQVDLLNEPQVEQVCLSLINQRISLYRLINNAGITHRSKASDTELTVFKNVMSINWLAAVKISQMLLPLLSDSKGKILCICSMAALMPVPGRAAYCASKSALNQHFETWRPELFNVGVGLSMIFPSFVATNIEQNAIGADGNKASHPQSRVGKLMTVENMADKIMAADESDAQRYYSSQLHSRIGYWLWTIFPRIFQNISWRNFRGEIK